MFRDRYIVVFKDTVADPTSRANGMAQANGLTVHHTYTSALKGFAATIPPARLARITADADVAYVWADGVVTIDGKPGGGGGPQTLPTGINRIDGELSLDDLGQWLGQRQRRCRRDRHRHRSIPP